MLPQDEEIFFAIITSAFLMIFLVIIIVFAVVKYQNKFRLQLQEMNMLKSKFDQEILKAQLEMKEQTLVTISQEIHDNIGQILSLVKLNLNTLPVEGAPIVTAKINTTKELVGKAIADLRSLSKSLNSNHILERSLADAINIELGLIQKLGIYNTNCQIIGTEKPIDPQKQLIIFRIVQELLNNIIKHSQARNINLSLEYLSDALMLTVADDGIGLHLEKSSSEKGTGIINMKFRAKLIGADFAIAGEKGAGTTAKLLLNLKS